MTTTNKILIISTLVATLLFAVSLYRYNISVNIPFVTNLDYKKFEGIWY
jgi:hypothetical protein